MKILLLSMKYQTEEQSHAIGISVYEYELNTLNEKLLWNT